MTGGYQTLNIDGMILAPNEVGLRGEIVLEKEISDVLYRNRKRLVVQVSGMFSNLGFTAVTTLDLNMLIDEQKPVYIGTGYIALGYTRFLLIIEKASDDVNYIAKMQAYLED